MSIKDIMSTISSMFKLPSEFMSDNWLCSKDGTELSKIKLTINIQSNMLTEPSKLESPNENSILL